MNKHVLSQIMAVGIIVLFVVLIFNTFFVFSLRSSLSQKMTEAQEKAKPAIVELVTLSASCSDCFNITPVLNSLQSAGLNVTSDQIIDPTSAEGKGIIEEYQISKLPTIIIKGQIEKVSIQGFTEINNALRFDAITPPYLDPKTQQVQGKVHAIVINDQRCDDCGSMTLLVDNLKQNGIVISQLQTFDALQALDKVSKYNITKLPALLLSQDIEAYSVAQNIKQSGIKIRQGYYVIESTPPYVEASSGKLRGKVNLLLITDKQCAECFDVAILEQVAGQLGLSTTQKKTADINAAEGVDVRLKYKLQKIPTMILTGDLTAYQGLDKIWARAGTIEDDGAYVFRNIELLGESIRYKDLTTGKVSDRSSSQ